MGQAVLHISRSEEPNASLDSRKAINSRLKRKPQMSCCKREAGEYVHWLLEAKTVNILRGETDRRHHLALRSHVRVRNALSGSMYPNAQCRMLYKSRSIQCV